MKTSSKTLLVLTATITALILAACSTANIVTTSPTGETCKASYTGLFRSSSAISMAACGAQGGAENSQMDEQARAVMTLLRGASK